MKIWQCNFIYHENSQLVTGRTLIRAASEKAAEGQMKTALSGFRVYQVELIELPKVELIWVK